MTGPHLSDSGMLDEDSVISSFAVVGLSVEDWVVGIIHRISQVIHAEL